jgi:hypothetical protein
MKQGAVDFLISHLQKSKDWQRVLNEVSQMSTIEFDLLEQAKEMQKENMILFAEWFKKSDWEHEMEYLYRHKKTMEVSDMMEIYEEYLKEHEPRT